MLESSSRRSRRLVQAPLAALLVAALVASAGPGWDYIGALEADDSSSRDQFGFDVALDGDTAVVGARLATGSDGSRGAAYVFERDLTGAWSQVAKLTPDDGEASGFGEQVAIAGDRIAVGARYDVFDGHRGGSIYTFVRDGDAWAQETKIHNPNSDGGSWSDSFGWALALDGERLAVGAYDADPDGVRDAGAAYVFAFDGAEWVLEKYLPSPILDQYQEFGIGIDIDGDTLLVGAQDSWQVEPDGGEAFVFTRDFGLWTLQATLEDPATDNLDAFGWAVALDGDTAVIGDYYEDVVGDLQLLEGAGAAYVFERTGTSWSRVATLTASQPSAWGFFGEAVAVQDGRVAVGSPYDPFGNTAGAAFSFTRGETGWQAERQFGDPQPRTYESFGESVALDGDTLIVGAIGDWFRGHAGGAHAFRYACEDGLEVLRGTAADGTASGTIHSRVEPLVKSRDAQVGGALHEANCHSVVVAEDMADEWTGGADVPISILD